MSDAVRVERIHDGRAARVVLDAGKGNVLTRAAIGELDEAFAGLAQDRAVRGVVLGHEGDHFSFGASVPEHAPDVVGEMLPELHRLMRTMDAAALPICAAVKGRCLGGGLELALAAHRIVVADDAVLGVPEVTLAVFPPVASAILPLRVSQAVVDRLVTRGETISGVEAVQLGVAEEAAPAADVHARAEEWIRGYVELSGAAVRFACRASRTAYREALGERLDRLERLYLDELMKTADAREGIAAFMERRKPTWVDR